MLVLLLFMHVLVVDWIIVIPYCITFLRIKLQRLQNQCARILTKSPRREHITPVKKRTLAQNSGYNHIKNIDAYI